MKSTETINGKVIIREFIMMDGSYHNKFTGQTFIKEKKTQLFIDGVLTVTLCGWNTMQGAELVKHLNRINVNIN